MPIKAECEGCGKVINARDDAAGRRIKCPECGDPISVPGPGGRRKKSARRKAAGKRPEEAGEPDLSNLDFGRLAAMERRGESLGTGTVEKCVACGEPVGERSEECPHCGEPHVHLKQIQKRAARRKAAAQKTVIVEDRRNFEKEPSSAPQVIVGVILVIALGVGGFFGYQYYQNSQEATPADNGADEMMDADMTGADGPDAG